MSASVPAARAAPDGAWAQSAKLSFRFLFVSTEASPPHCQSFEVGLKDIALNKNLMTEAGFVAN